MNIKLKGLLLPLLRAVKEGRPITFKMRSCASQSLYLIEKPVSLKSKAAKVRQRSEKQSARASHNQETAKIREEVFARAGGRCELGSELPPEELHHLEGGSGRRALQTIENCMAVSRFAHRLFHRDPEAFRGIVLQWATKYGYPVPRRYRGPPKLIAAGPSKTAPSSEVSETNPEPAKAGGAP